MALVLPNQPHALSRKVISGKYKASYAGEIPYKSKHNSSRAPWFSIKKGLNWFKRNYKWEVNNGENLCFLYKNWTNRDPLFKAFPKTFALAIDKNATIKDRWDYARKAWTLDFIRTLNERETNTWNYIKGDSIFSTRKRMQQANMESQQ
ncbi:LINE-1 retrotransposable element ORF2 protein [Cucumis melo var. makuwa]|uniref:LINE-1 retrotransposable element ORF2 protein n=1 Tax=Cucumis melo var. makuwa TaxID=1194695 RepID=A0A5D3CYF8_CUCMM|nr:LINE-1 retrotransposable element ORF2 protein [Cucumis melo var. makuwa]TYK16827.1 LINE-1 retrotransposable element ORF2 protein [Cucumis melo var. makuwa]